MLKRLHLKNFTVFADADFEFSPGLNVLVGTNGTGKSHVLKLGYAVESISFSLNKEAVKEAAKEVANKDSETFVKKPKELYSGQFAWMFRLKDLLPEIFRSGSLNSLINWNTNQQARIAVALGEYEREEIDFRIHNKIGNSDSVIRVNEVPSEMKNIDGAVFIPARDILTLSWILPGSEQLVLPLEKNYLDLLNQLRLLPLRNSESREAITALTDIVGGEVRAEGDTYFLVDTTGRRVPINMVAEGLRKFGTLQKLLANGSLTKNTTLYWDEPEANLNPALLRKLAAILAELARQGFQIILATHSTDLLKEFHILSRQKDAQPLPIKYFGLNAEPGEATRIVSTDNFEYLPDVVALSEELKQADELEEIFIREDREYYANNRGEE